MEIGFKTAVALLTILAYMLYGIVGMSKEIKQNLITHTEYELRR